MVALNIYPIPRTPCSYRAGEQKRDIAINHEGSFVFGRGDNDVILQQDRERITAALNKVTLAQMGTIAKTFNSIMIDCPQCNACYASRINIADFRLSASQRRKMRLNQDISFNISPLHIDEEITDLVNSYYKQRFPEEGLHDSSVQSTNMELGGSYHMATARHISGKLMGASFIDVMPEGIIGTLTVYDIEESKKRSLGMMMDLWTLQYAQEKNIPYMYLGPWAKDSRIQHKSQYRGFEVMAQDGETSRWQAANTLSDKSNPKRNNEIAQELGLDAYSITELGLHR